MKGKIPIRALTIALFATGGAIAAIAIFQQLEIVSEPYAISKEEAITIALNQVDKEPNRDASFLPNEEASAKLVHVNEGGTGFVVDEDSLGDMLLYSKEGRFKEIYANSYFWHVDVTTYNSEGSRGYSYLIDANGGQVIGNDRDYAAFDMV